MTGRYISQEQLNDELDRIAERTGIPLMPVAPPIPDGKTAHDVEVDGIRAKLESDRRLEKAVADGTVAPFRRPTAATENEPK